MSRMAKGAAEPHDAHLGVLLRAAQAGQQVVGELAGDRVAALGAVQRERGDGPGRLEANGPRHGARIEWT